MPFTRLMFPLRLCAIVIASIAIAAVNAAPNKAILVNQYQDFLGDPVATGNVKTFELTAKASELSLSGGKTTQVWSYNNQIPGPVLRVTKGDMVKVNFTNGLTQSTTIHWHGVRVPNAMDGVPMVTQPPIKPGEQFSYEFQALDAGTYWFHPHFRSHEQVERGLYGVLIVENPSDPDYDQEWIWVLDDWLLNQDGVIEDSFDADDNDLDPGGRLGNLLTVSGKSQPRYKARTGERIRLRVVNASNARNFSLDLANITNKVFAVDGNTVKKLQQSKGFIIAPGNRLDIDLTIPSTNTNNSVITVNNDFFHREATGDVLTGPGPLATIEIVGEVKTTKTFAPPTNPNVPDWPSALATNIDYSYDFNTQINFGFLFNGPMAYYVINGKRYGEHEVNKLNLNRYYHLRFTNGTGLYHPIHIHGMFFKVLSRDGVKVDEPYFRDTALLDYNGSMEIGVVPVDAGKWMLHCHLLEHSAMGMMTLVEVVE